MIYKNESNLACGVDAFVGCLLLVELHPQGLLHMGLVVLPLQSVDEKFSCVNCPHTQEDGLPESEAAPIKHFVVAADLEEVFNDEETNGSQYGQYSNHNKGGEPSVHFDVCNQNHDDDDCDFDSQGFGE